MLSRSLRRLPITLLGKIILRLCNILQEAPLTEYPWDDIRPA